MCKSLHVASQYDLALEVTNAQNLRCVFQHDDTTGEQWCIHDTGRMVVLFGKIANAARQ